ncbi:ANTAR domain-containing protein [Streptomyces sp. NPDC052225]|uniref:ANTAR domain-containing protein n=1 Tax=Streptomyces sp. NPDC052225 TaxID=3154949 RepID=UPI00341E07BC
MHSDRQPHPAAGNPAEEDLESEVRSLRDEVRSLRTQERARSRVALAQGMLMGRYHLPDGDTAFTLLRESSQRFNVKLHQVAAALSTTSPPPDRDSLWFPGRTRTDPPALTGLRAGPLDPRNQGEVLKAALHRVMDVVGAESGNAQLQEADVLRMERHEGHPRAFVDYFAFVGDGTSCHRAAHAARQVTVRDVASTEIFDEETRQVILDSGSRAAHSVPLTGLDGIARGVISSHHARPLTGFRPVQLAELDRIQHMVGGWLSWHAGTVLRDALEHLHLQAAGISTR